LDVDDSGPQPKYIETCNATTIPTDFNIFSDGGVVYGNVGVCLTNTRPPGTHTQWIDFIVYTANYFGAGDHTPVVPWFKHTLHGHGMYFGDTSASACTNGQDARYNTRMEGWSQWFGYESQPGPYWTSTGTYFSDTCGATWQDGWYPPFATYNVDVHASDGQWVQYYVRKWNSSTYSWDTVTGPLVRNLTYSSWPTGPGVFDSSANGIFIGSTGSGSSWTIAIRSLAVGWF
jgi:hypothetical protein